jgi:hypothetical protein
MYCTACTSGGKLCTLVHITCVAELGGLKNGREKASQTIHLEYREKVRSIAVSYGQS